MKSSLFCKNAAPGELTGHVWAWDVRNVLAGFHDCSYQQDFQKAMILQAAHRATQAGTSAMIYGIPHLQWYIAISYRFRYDTKRYVDIICLTTRSVFDATVFVALKVPGRYACMSE